jgi:hypothetical protein
MVTQGTDGTARILDTLRRCVSRDATQVWIIVVRRIGAPPRRSSSDSVILTVLLAAAKGAPMSGSSAKQKVLEVIEKLPADATLEDAIERLVLLAKTERGLAELDSGQGVDHAEAKRRLLR